MGLGGVASQGGGFILPAGVVENRHSQVADRREVLRSLAGPHTAGVFPKRHVPDVVQAVFDPPVAAGEFKQAGGIGSIPREAGDPVGHFRCGLISDRAGAFESKDLLDPRPVQVAVEGGGAGELAGFDPAVALVEA